jgi:hypothetical protein
LEKTNEERSLEPEPLVTPLSLINNVWYVDGLKHNLLSISQFCDSGYKTIFDKDTCTVINVSDKSTVFVGQRKDNVYKINYSDLVDHKAICLLPMNDGK